MPAVRRIMHVITGLGSGGAEGQLALLAARQQAAGPAPVVITMVSGGPNERNLTADGVAVTSLRMTRGRPTAGAVIRLARLIRRHEPDILAMLALALSGRWRKTVLIWSLRCSQMEFEHYRPALKRVVRACATSSRLPAAVVANSAAGRDFYRSLGYRPKAFHVIGNGIDTGKFRPDAAARTGVRRKLGIADDAPLLAMVARVDPMKDHDTFLQALDRLPECAALAIGEGTETLPGRRNLHRLGLRDDVPRLLAACDAVVSCSAFGEGFSNAIAEGMASGLPAVATDVGDAKMIIGDAGAVVPPRDPVGLAQAVAEILAQDHRALGRAARQRIARLCSVDRMVDAYAALYRECRERRRRGAASVETS